MHVRARRSRSPLDGSAELISVKQLILRVCVCVAAGSGGCAEGGAGAYRVITDGWVHVGGWKSFSF